MRTKIFIVNCKFCNNEIKTSDRVKKFCNSSCAAKYNNRGRIRTEKSKLKTSETIKKLYKEGTLIPSSKIRCIKQNKLCLICNTETANQRLTCSRECFIENLRKHATKNYIKNKHLYHGPHKKSWMEKSFSKWLNDNNIFNNINGYLEQVHFKYKFNGKIKNGWADFVFPRKKLIIELDGNHHENRKDLDNIRDIYLMNKGYIVIRIKYNEYKSKNRLNEIKTLLGIWRPW